jgi:hypothetical protein
LNVAVNVLLSLLTENKAVRSSGSALNEIVCLALLISSPSVTVNLTTYFLSVDA